MTVVLHLVGLIVVAARVVHHHDEGAVELAAHHLLVEGARGVLARLAYLPSVLVAEGVGELLRGLAHGELQHVVDLAEHAHLGFLERGLLASLLHHLAQLQTILAQLRGDETRDAARVLGGIGLGHHLRGHQAVLVGQVGHAAEGAAVVQRMMEEELHALVVDGLIAVVYDALQHEVGLLKLVVEEEVGLREVHREAVAMTAGKVAAQHVQSAEHPAASRLLLVGDALLGRLDAEMGVDGAGQLRIAGQVVDAVARNGVHQGAVGRRELLFFLNVAEHALADAPFLLLSRCREGHEHGCQQ